MPVPLRPLVDAECVRRILTSDEVGYTSINFHNGGAIFVCEKLGSDPPIPFHEDEIFTPTMTLELIEKLEIDENRFWELREKLCDPDPLIDEMN